MAVLWCGRIPAGLVVTVVARGARQQADDSAGRHEDPSGEKSLPRNNLNVADRRALLAGVPRRSGDALPGVAEIGDDLELAAVPFLPAPGSSQRPDLPPATSSTALRTGSKMNKILTSLAPLDPGRSSFRLCSRDPAIRSASGLPRDGPSSISRSIASATSLRVTGSPERPAESLPVIKRSTG